MTPVKTLSVAGQFGSLQGQSSQQQQPRPDSGRPDGQSPEAATESTTISRLASNSTLSDVQDGNSSVGDQLEYDDYIPHLPGSYFEMDPHAYTLTWSTNNGKSKTGRAGTQVPSAAAAAAVELSHQQTKSLTDSDASLGPCGINYRL
jgi:hypothetical protein